ncbi:hypothetical protein D3C72_1624740 [compost metagenome]
MYHRLSGVLPAQDAPTIGEAENRLVTRLDLVFVVVAKIGGTGAPSALVIRQAQFLVDAGFRVQIGVA